MGDSLQRQPAEQQIAFRFNLPNSPHFGGVWEREVKAVKVALRVTEAVLRTVLIEVEGMLNLKPLGYVSSDLADPDPITPNILLMVHHDASLPQAMYAASDVLGNRRWRQSQFLEDHFWVNFLRNYLPDLQV